MRTEIGSKSHTAIWLASIQGTWARSNVTLKEFFTMKKYEAPEVRVDTFAIEDVMTASTHFDIPEENPYE